MGRSHFTETIGYKQTNVGFRPGGKAEISAMKSWRNIGFVHLHTSVIVEQPREAHVSGYLYIWWQAEACCLRNVLSKLNKNNSNIYV